MAHFTISETKKNRRREFKMNVKLIILNGKDLRLNEHYWLLMLCSTGYNINKDKTFNDGLPLPNIDSLHGVAIFNYLERKERSF
ncbi:hypothetical protein DERF_004252 [Dermatophagoides farinae]|uniref:Uncharacterized protein n=1 Tax=Dermatophagoides farinae TaxID=6954 RepID=A0A922I1J8_DERFA|nr:hypothetical protein DERF_004252 [Dermatophagoides farinae]